MWKQLQVYKRGMALVVALSFLLTPLTVSPVGAETREVFDTVETQDVYLYRGDLVSLKVYSLTRIAVSNPGVIELANADVDELVIVGQTEGETTLYVWDEYGKRQIFIRVLERDLDVIILRINRLLDTAGITSIELKKNMYEGKIIVLGGVFAHQKEKLQKILQPFTKYLMEMSDEDGELIQVDVQISELNTTLSKTLGIDWSAGTTAGVALGFEETLPDMEPGLKDLFKIGKFGPRTDQILATVNALIAEGEARVLSKPSIVVRDGESSSFLVGGEIPVKQTTTSTGGTSVQESISYSSYGIDVQVTPTIVGDKIEIELNVNIRDVDTSNAVGENVAFTTKSADTQLILNNGQTIVLAGLIKQNNSETMTGVPFLRRVPVLGMLFRNRNWPTNSEQEVVISLTPRVVTQRKMDFESEEMRSKYKIADEITSKKENEELDLADDLSKEEILFDEEFLEIEKLSETEEDVEVEDATSLMEGDMEALEVGEEKTEDKASEIEKDEAEFSGLISTYVQEIQSKIARAISYPYEANEKGWEGTVTLSMVIVNDGSLNDVSVKESSGHNIFDKDAVNTARILAPFKAFPEGLELEQIVVTVPIVYSKEAIFEGTDIK